MPQKRRTECLSCLADVGSVNLTRSGYCLDCAARFQVEELLALEELRAGRRARRAAEMAAEKDRRASRRQSGTLQAGAVER